MQTSSLPEWEGWKVLNLRRKLQLCEWSLPRGSAEVSLPLILIIPDYIDIINQMLAKIAPRFVISRVIQNAHTAESMCVELLKQPLGYHDEYFGTIDASNYHVQLE